MILFLLKLSICAFSPFLVAETIPKPAIRVRMNHGIFEQASNIVAGLVEYETPRIRIPSTQQCFAEGCVQIHSFRVTSFRQPSLVSLAPYPPNQMLLRVQDLDFFVTGSLGGSINVILTFPVSGTVYTSGRSISISAYLDLQKSVDDRPYLRFLSCQIDGGTIDTRVANMGLFTDTINTKYRGQMTSQTRQLLQEAICANIHRLTQQHFSDRMEKFPTSVSAKTLVEMMLKPSSKSGEARFKRSMPEMTKQRNTPNDDSGKSAGMQDDERKQRDADQEEEQARAVRLSSDEVSRFFNYNRLKHLFVDANLLDAAASYDDYSVGMSGNVFSTKDQSPNPFLPPFPYRLPRSSRERMLEIGIAQYTLNSMLWHAHRTNSLLFHVDSKTPKIGALLKTTCTLDEVCLSDQIEEVGQKFPDRQLELIIRTTQPPNITISKEKAIMTMEGRTLFFLEGTREKVGVLPFAAKILVKINSHGSTVKGSLKIEDFRFLKGVDFFGLKVEDLEGFKNSIKGTMENMVNKALDAGISLSTEDLNLPLRLSSPIISLEDGILMLQANLDLYSTLYQDTPFQSFFFKYRH
ncbi:unnamed protein product, partial [Mesorhabditis belari]|uniref:Lipid-binding serum glycoprotein C-terminal domain-containing protein n=1 Tax=Mesorhabditis belari TaxID=2138241 RepID=A0AAF3F1K0_9BILA